MGIFNPENAQSALTMLSMMDFDGREEIIRRVSEGEELYNAVEQLKMQNQQLMGFIAELRRGTPGMDGAMKASHPTSPGGNPVAVAARGAERAALTDYGKTLVDRANDVKEE